VKAMAEVLNKAGPFSANSEVVIAAPSIHLLNLKSVLRPDIAVASEVSFQQVLPARFSYPNVLLSAYDAIGCWLQDRLRCLHR
jgi:hypothetical protein